MEIDADQAPAHSVRDYHDCERSRSDQVSVFRVSIIARGSCQVPHWLNWIMVAYMATMIVLFSQFYVRRYLGGNTEAKPKSS